MRTAQFDQLLHYFAEHARQEGERWVCFRYVREIAEALKRDRRTIQRWLRRLETLGLVRTELTFHRHGGNGPNRYVLNFSPEGVPEKAKAGHGKGQGPGDIAPARFERWQKERLPSRFADPTLALNRIRRKGIKEERFAAESLKLEGEFLRLAERLRPDLPQKELRHRFAAFQQRYRERKLSHTGWLVLWSAFLRRRHLPFEEVAPYLRLWFRRHYGSRPLPKRSRQTLQETLMSLREGTVLGWLNLLNKLLESIP